jgi:hypothetical protein
LLIAGSAVVQPVAMRGQETLSFESQSRTPVRINCPLQITAFFNMEIFVPLFFSLK